MALIKSGVSATVVIVVSSVLAACGGDPLECKDATHKTAVQFVLKSQNEAGKDTPEMDAAKAQARSKWEGEAKQKFGAEWASWTNTKRKSETCGAPQGQQTWTCEVEAAPCKKR